MDTATQTTTARACPLRSSATYSNWKELLIRRYAQRRWIWSALRLQLHAEALEHVRILADSSADSKAVLAAFERDALVRSVLLLHGFSDSEPVEARVHRALADLQPTLQKYGAAVEVARR